MNGAECPHNHHTFMLEFKKVRGLFFGGGFWLRPTEAEILEVKKRVQACVHSPLQLVIGPRRERGALDDLAHLLATEAEVVDGPHV